MRSALKWSLALGALAVLLAAGCVRKERGHNYVVRGQVVELPSPANGNLLHLHHEAIDDCVTRDGKVDGMDSMTMPFLVAESVPLAGHPGRRQDRGHPARRLAAPTGRSRSPACASSPPDSTLDFRAAQPPGKP